jgi:hypothetical protein
MKRLLWLGVGLAVGALVFRALSKKAASFTPSGIAASARDTAGGLVESVRSFVEDVREGMAEREDEIHAAFADGVALDDAGRDDAGLDELGDFDPEEGSYRR